MTSGPAGDDGGRLRDLLAERFGDPEPDRYMRPPTRPQANDGDGPTRWWSEELRRNTLAEEVESDDIDDGPDSGPV